MPICRCISEIQRWGAACSSLPSQQSRRCDVKLGVGSRGWACSRGVSLSERAWGLHGLTNVGEIKHRTLAVDSPPTCWLHRIACSRQLSRHSKIQTMRCFLCNGRWTEKQNDPWLVTNNEYNKVRAASKCLQMKKTWQGQNATMRANRKTKVTSQDKCSSPHLWLSHLPPRLPCRLLLHVQISQSGSHRSVVLAEGPDFVWLAHRYRSRWNTNRIWIWAHASSFFKDILRYHHMHWLKYLWLHKQDHDILGWRGAHTTCKTSASVSWVFAYLGWFTWAACHILSWWPSLS